MPPKRAIGVAVASASPAPVDPTAASPLHSVCARRADHHCGLTAKAVNQILRDFGFAASSYARDGGFSRYRFREKYLDHVAEKFGVPFLSR